jgi:hypothetical protein
MSVDLKTLTPDTTINDSAVLFGADSQASSSPSVYAVSTVRQHIVGTANTFTQPQVISVNSSTDALRITQTGTGNALEVEDSANPDSTPFIIGPDGEIRIGFSGSVPVGSAVPRQLQSIVVGDAVGGSGGASFSRFSNDASGAVLAIGKSRGTSASQFTVVNSGDSLGAINKNHSSYLF